MNRLFPVAVGCLAVTMLIGLVTAMATVLETPLIDFRTLNSSHTLFALGFVIAGALGAAQVAVGRPPPRPQVIRSWSASRHPCWRWPRAGSAAANT